MNKTDVDYRGLLKKLVLQEFDFFGECQTLSSVTEDGASSYVSFTGDEKSAFQNIVDDAHAEWIARTHESSDSMLAASLPSDQGGAELK